MNTFETTDNQPITPSGEEEAQQSTVEVNDRGHILSVPHPEIADEALLASDNPIPERTLVTINFSPEIGKKLPFKDYLTIIGLSDYKEYEQFCQLHPDLDQDAILRTIQQETIERRLAEARELDQKDRSSNDRAHEIQKVTTKEHAVIWRKVINDLGLPGITAGAATQVNDFLDGIDEFIDLDLAELGVGDEGEVYTVGVQRSFDRKYDEVRKDPVRYLPELADRGPIFRVFVQDHHRSYNMYTDLAEKRDTIIREEAEKAHKGITEYIDEKAEQLGLSSREYLVQRLEKLSLYKFLPSGMMDELLWAEDIVTQTMYQLQTYLNSARDWHKENLKKGIAALKEILEMIKEEKIATELNDNKEEAPTHE